MFAQYLRLSLKRNILALPLTLLISAVFLAVLLFLGSGLVQRNQDSGNARKIEAGVVGDFESSPYLRFAVDAMQHFDTSRYEITFREMKEEDARKALNRGTLDLYVVIPDGFVEAVGSYENDVQIRYVTTNGAAGIGGLLVDEIAADISRLVEETQNAIFGMQSYAFLKELPVNVYLAGDRLTEAYGLAILNRSGLFDVTERKQLIPSFSLSLFTGLMVLYLLLTGVSAAPFRDKDPKTKSLLLIRRGLPDGLQYTAEALSDCLNMLFLALPLFLLLLLLRKPASAFIRELSGLSFLSGLWIYLRLFPVLFAFSALQQLLSELFRKLFTGITAQFITALFLAFFSGCLYPISYFPERFVPFMKLLPAAGAKAHIENLFLGQTAAKNVLLLLAYGVLFHAAAYAARSLKRRWTA